MRREIYSNTEPRERDEGGEYLNTPIAVTGAAAKKTGWAHPTLESELCRLQTTNVGVGDMLVGLPPTMMATVLGSCVGTVLYDPETKVGGLSHIMLPETGCSKEDPAKFANTAIPAVLKKMLRAGADKKRITARIVGGSNMLGLQDSAISNIGRSNIEAVRGCLAKERIPIMAEVIGGKQGRTIFFALDTGLVYIKSKNDLVTVI